MTKVLNEILLFSSMAVFVTGIVLAAARLLISPSHEQETKKSPAVSAAGLFAWIVAAMPMTRRSSSVSVCSLPLVPAKAGTQPSALDSRFRGNERSLLRGRQCLI
jgi:hypothetical protein